MSALQKKTLIAAAAFLSLQTIAIFAKYFADVGDGRFGGDFLTFWQTGQRLMNGDVPALYNPDLWRNVTPDNAPPLITWFVYPPFALFGLWPFGALDYGPSVLAWSIAPLPLYFFLMFKIAHRAGFPASRQGVLADFAPYFCLGAASLPFLTANILTGQTGAFIAVFFMGAVYCWRTRPILAGICIGLIAVKPQMGLLLPIALLAAGQWRSILAAAVTILVLSIAATVCFGPGVWSEYAQMTQIFGHFIGQDYQGIKRLAMGPYVSLIAAGLPPVVAASAQVIITLMIVAVIWRLFRVQGPSQAKTDDRDDLRLGLLAAGVLLATPYAQTYDTPLLILAVIPMIARRWRTGFSTLEITALAALVMVPLAQPALIQSHIPFGFLALAAWFITLCNRTRGLAPVPNSGLVFSAR